LTETSMSRQLPVTYTVWAGSPNNADDAEAKLATLGSARYSNKAYSISIMLQKPTRGTEGLFVDMHLKFNSSMLTSRSHNSGSW